MQFQPTVRMSQPPHPPLPPPPHTPHPSPSPPHPLPTLPTPPHPSPPLPTPSPRTDLGKDLCPNCVLQLPHGSKRCGSTLAYHRDRGDAANSQDEAMNLSISVGHGRTLSMQLRLEHAGYQELVSPTTPIETTFPLSLGSVFQLHPGDEERQPRVVEEGGDIFIGAYLHGVPQELSAGQISCGFVFRCVHQTRDVDSMTRRVIPTQAEVGPARQEKLRVFKKARREWAAQAPLYAEAVSEKVRKALASWSWWKEPPYFG